MSEGFRMSLTPHLVPHMAPWAVYLALIGFTVGLCAWGIQGFSKRVLS
jgi:hypothetical protein